MKYFKRANIYKNSSGSNTFNPETFRAYSYSWWRYVEDFDGILVFNTYRISNTTAKHQSDMRSLLIDLGYDLDKFWFIEAPRGLQDLNSAKEYYQLKIRRLETEIAKPRTHKTKNKERLGEINGCKAAISMIKKLQASAIATEA